VIAEDVGIEEANRGALGELYARHAQGAGRLAYLLTGERQLAEDLVQDAFVRVAQRFVHLRDPGAFDAYLRKTIVNLANSYFRRRVVERRHLQRESAARPGRVDETDRSDREALKGVLLRLPLRQRTAIVLRFYEDLPERHVAELMGCRPGTVRALVFQGMTTLRQRMVVSDD
jgi:RNA polymerase sigma-70 factor (sigma-E family)